MLLGAPHGRRGATGSCADDGGQYADCSADSRTDGGGRYADCSADIGNDGLDRRVFCDITRCDKGVYRGLCGRRVVFDVARHPVWG